MVTMIAFETFVMMKPILCFATILLLAASALGVQTDAQIQAMFSNFVTQCKASEKSTDADTNAFSNDKVPASQQGKCFVGCVYEKMGLLVNGQFSLANANKMAAEDFPATADAANKAEALRVFKLCDGQLKGKTNKCVTGPLLMTCIATNEKL